MLLQSLSLFRKYWIHAMNAVEFLRLMIPILTRAMFWTFSLNRAKCRYGSAKKWIVIIMHHVVVHSLCNFDIEIITITILYHNSFFLRTTFFNYTLTTDFNWNFLKWKILIVALTMRKCSHWFWISYIRGSSWFVFKKK